LSEDGDVNGDYVVMGIYNNTTTVVSRGPGWQNWRANRRRRSCALLCQKTCCDHGSGLYMIAERRRSTLTWTKLEWTSSQEVKDRIGGW
jgi:hypothetical protein